MLRSLLLLSKGPCGELLRMDKVNPVLSAKNRFKAPRQNLGVFCSLRVTNPIRL